MKTAYVVATYPVGQPKVFRNMQFYTRPAETRNKLVAFTDVRLAERWREWVTDETRRPCVLCELDVDHLAREILKMPVDYNVPCNSKSKRDTWSRKRFFD
jgi:hypothetical protein